MENFGLIAYALFCWLVVGLMGALNASAQVRAAVYVLLILVLVLFYATGFRAPLLR